MIKRGRSDGQVSKGDYYDEVENDSSHAVRSGTFVAQSNVYDLTFSMLCVLQGEFSRATPNTMAARRIVVAQRTNKKEEFAKHILALNQSFHAWFKEQIGIDPTAQLTDGFQVCDQHLIQLICGCLMTESRQDYLDHLSVLEDRYLRTYGEVLTFGSGDCGQLAHGIEEDEDLMVKYPRVVYSLR